MANQKFLPISFLRDVVERLKRKYPKFTITQSSLILRNVITNGQTNYVFQINGSNPEAERPAIRLQQNDVFVGIEMGYFLKSEVRADPGTGRRATWANPAIFGANPAIDLECFYDAHLKIEQDNNIIGDPIYTGDFLYIPETQQRALLTDGATPALNVSPAIARDAWTPQMGFREATPAFIFNGKRENRANLSLKGIPSPAWQSGDANVDFLVELHFRGVKVQGAAQNEYDAILEELMRP